jgi:beta-lactamase superfamily II metal-dependent hydrolase
MVMKYINQYTATLRDNNGNRMATLIWGDPVHVINTSGNKAEVYARGIYKPGWVDKNILMDNSLLEIYIIDVGQGDGVLVKTPDGLWHLIDAGVANKNQMTKKGTANFLRWKFYEDLKLPKVSLENAFITHPDYDHYGGMIDVLSGKLYDGRTFNIEVKNFYHNGMGKFDAAPEYGNKVNGKVQPFPQGYKGIRTIGSFITELLSNKNSFNNPPRKLNSTFDTFAKLVGSVPNNVQPLSSAKGFVPGYHPGVNAVAMHILGPILEQTTSGIFGLRYLSSKSKTFNGHSILLRLDYGNARILLTGDLNYKSQRLLMSYIADPEFKVDVAKCCHHGSEDIDFDFIKAINAKCTVISSGDNEDYAHPRPIVIGASGRYGRDAVTDEDEVIPPLIYSTELARSVKLSYAYSVRVDLDKDPTTPTKFVRSEYTTIKAKGSNQDYKKLDWTPISTDLIYGLVNVRTDGNHILCATMLEKGNDFDVKVFKAG